jgi:hypothetical protein
MTTEPVLPRPHPLRRPYPTVSHIHTGPLVITTPPSLTDSTTRLIHLCVYDSRTISCTTSPSQLSLYYAHNLILCKYYTPYLSMGFVCRCLSTSFPVTPILSCLLHQVPHLSVVEYFILRRKERIKNKNRFYHR